jgi:hypothetical protein
MIVVVVITGIHAECLNEVHYAEYRYNDCCYAVYRYAEKSREEGKVMNADYKYNKSWTFFLTKESDHSLAL